MSEQAYIQLLDDLYNNGMAQDNRTGVDAIRKVFNADVYDTCYGTKYNLFQHKKLVPDSIIGELVCFIQGKTNAADFREQSCNVWNANANEHGTKPNLWLSNPMRKGEDDLGPIYGKQWRMWEDTKIINVGIAGPDYNTHRNKQIPTMDYVKDEKYVPELGAGSVGQEPKIFEQLRYMKKFGYIKVSEFLGPNSEINYVMHRKIDQLAKTINDIRNAPTSRRMIISAWNPADMEFMALPPCHVLQHYLCTKLTEAERLTALKARLENVYLWQHEVDLESSSTDVTEEYISAQTAMEDIHEFTAMTHDSLDQWNAPSYRLDIVMFQRSVNERLH